MCSEIAVSIFGKRILRNSADGETVRQSIYKKKSFETDSRMCTAHVNFRMFIMNTIGIDWRIHSEQYFA